MGNVFHVSIESWKHEWKFGRMRYDVGRGADKRVFLQLFRVLPNFHECFHNLRESRKTYYVTICLKYAMLHNLYGSTNTSGPMSFRLDDQQK